MNRDDIKAKMKVKVKSGKTYIVYAAMNGGPQWSYQNPETEVLAVQWQVNDKHPAGRFYGPCRYLRISELTAIGAPSL